MSGTVSTIGTGLLGIVGGGTVTPTTPTPTQPLPEPLKNLKAEFRKLSNAGKLSIADESKKPYFPIKKMNDTVRLFNQALEDLNQEVAESAKNELATILRDVENQMDKDVIEVRRKDWYRNQLKLLDEGELRQLARADSRLEKAEAECLAAIKQAKNDFSKNPEKLYDVNQAERAVSGYINERNAARKNETLSVYDVIDRADQDAETPGSVAWFNKIKEEVELEPEPSQEEQRQQQGELEWDQVKQDIATQWGNFVNSGYSFALRGPTMPTNLRTPYVMQKCTAGKAYRIANKVYKVGPSDTGGMSLKTEIPQRHQGYNANGGWVQSFIYHIGS